MPSPSAASRTSVPRRRFACAGFRDAVLAGTVALIASPAFAVDLVITRFLESNPASDPSPAGATIAYDVRFENASSVVANNTRIAFDLPAGAALAAGSAPQCAASVTVPTRVNCSFGDITGTPAGGVPVDFVIRVGTVGLSPQTITTRAAIGNGSALGDSDPLPTGPGSPFFGADTNPNNNVAQESTTLEQAGNLEVSKVASPSPVNGGAEVTWTVTVRNLGPSTSNSIVVTDSLPAGVSYVAGSFANSGADTAGTSYTLASTPPVAPGAGGTLVANLSSLANGGTAIFSFRARVNVGSGNITNGVGVSSASADPIPDNNSFTLDTPVNPGADLALTKSVAPAPAIAGQAVTYTLRPRNLGPSTAVNASFTDTLPGGFTLAATPLGSNWVCTGNPGDATFTCTRSAFAVGASDDVTAVVNVPVTGPGSSGTQTNNASITSATPDGLTTNNNASVSVTVLPDGADLAISKTKTPAAVASGGTLTSTIRVQNLGPRAASGNIVVVDDLSANEQWNGISPSGWTCTGPTTGGAQVVCTFSGPYPVATGTFVSPNLVLTTIATAASSNTQVDNRACTGGSLPAGGSNPAFEPAVAGPVQGDPNLANDCASAGSRTTTLSTDLSISKTAITASGDRVLDAAESTVTYTIAVTNGATATTGVVINDPIPGWVSGQSTATVGSVGGGPLPPLFQGAGNCSISGGGSLVCRANSNTMAASETVTIELRVDRPLFDSVGQSPACAGTSTVGLAHWHCNTAGVGVDLTQPDSAADTNGANNSDGDAVQIDRVANVRTTAKTPVGGSAAQNGVDKTYTISFLNAGPSPAPAQRFRDTFTLAANDPGFVLVSANRTGGGATACTPTTTGSVTSAAAPGGTSYTGGAGGGTVVITCSALSLANNQSETLTVVIRPNIGAGRTITNTATFLYDPDGDGVANTPTGSDANGSFSFNSVANAADDERSASITTVTDAVDLITNKIDFEDPIGFDPGNAAGNRVVYRVTVRNSGPSLATQVRIADVIDQLPAGRTLHFVGDGAAQVGPFTPSACAVSAGTNPVIGPATLTLDCLMPATGGFTTAGTVAAGTTSTLYLQFEYQTPPAASGDTFRNTATASAQEVETNPGNNVENETTTVRARADVSVVKSLQLAAPDTDPGVELPPGATSVTLRQPHFYVLDALNEGPGASLSLDRAVGSQLAGTGTVVTDTLPVGLRVTGPITWRKVGPAQAATTPDGIGTCSTAAAVPFTVAAGTRTVTCAVGDVTSAVGNPGRIRIIVPAEWPAYPPSSTGTTTHVVNTAAVSTEQVDPANANNTTSLTTAVTRAALAGTAFEDRDRAGANAGTPQAAASEPRIAGVTVTLTGTDAYGNAVSRTAITDASGNYLFNDLAPSNAAGYTLTQTQPAGFANGPVGPPAFGSAAGPSLTAGTPAYSRPAATGDSTYTGVVVGTNESGVRYNFPEVRQPTLSGFVYVDANFNNVRDPGSDPAISGATVRLLDAAGTTVLATTTTSGIGAYTFDFAALGLDPLATYVIEQPLPGPPGTYLNRPSAVNPGLEGSAPCAGCAAAGDTPSAGTDRITGVTLASGQNGTQFNFGEVLNSSTGIAGFVYVDRNNNGSFENGGADAGTDNSQPNGGLQGVSMRLEGAGADGIFGNGDDPAPLTLLTGADGSYRFDNLVAGQNYRVLQTQPAGFGNGLQNPGGTITVNNLATTGSVGNNFGERLSSVAGVVYLDSNNNGLRDGGEPPIPGVVITLTGTTGAGAVTRTATTLADGSYRFDDLLSGTYAATQQAAQPVVGGVTTIDARTFAGSTGGTGSAVGTSPSAITGIVLPVAAVSTANNFSETLPVAVNGTVYLDGNNNGSIEPGESGVGGQVIRITGTDDRGQPVSIEVTTQPDGTWSAPSLRPGTYTVTQPNQPPNTANGITTAGSAGGTATPPTTTPSAITPITLTTPGGSSVGNNFGEIPNNASIAGRVWLDRDNDGVIDAGEAGIPNVVVVLTGTDVNGAAVNVTVQTDANGSYRFDGLLPGTYTVTEPAQPPGTGNGRTLAGSTGGTATPVATTPSVIAGIPLAAGQASIGNNFGEVPLSSIAGFVYNDRDNDGVRDPGEPGYAGVVIRLTGTDDLGTPVTRETTTAADGSYRFAGLRPGTFTVTEPAQPADTSNGITTPGSTGGTATPVGTLPSAISGIVLAAGVDSVENNFGEIGDTPDVVVSKSATPTRFATNAAGTYTIRVRNQGQRPTVGEVLVVDRLPIGVRLTAAPGGNGWTCTGAANDDRFECRSSAVIAAATTSPAAITVPVRVAANVPNGAMLNNAVLVSGGGEPDFRGPTHAERDAFNGDVTLLPVCDPAVTQNACRTPTVVVQSAALSGSVWYDIGSTIALRDGGDRPLRGWTVELVDPATGQVIATQLTGPDGRYRFVDLAPGAPYRVRFREPGGVLWGFPVNGETAPNAPAPCDRDAAIAGGTQSSCVLRTQGITEIDVVLAAGRELVEQSLPVVPSGVVYDAITRQPVPGSVVTLAPVGACAGWSPATQVLNATAGGYTVSGASIAMTVGQEGFYQFLFAPTAPARCTFQITVTPPPTHGFVSTLIPPQTGTLSPPGGPNDTFRVQPQSTPPTVVPGPGTAYWLLVSTGSTAPNIVHNHLPLDPRTPPGLSISKLGDRHVAEVGDTVLYTLVVRQTAGGALPNVSVLDVLPPGFTYVAGTARVDGVPIEPAGAPGSRLGFTLGPIAASGQRTLTYRVRVGVGSQQGDGINRATAVGCGIVAGCLLPGTLDPIGGAVVSNQAQYRVRVSGGVFATEACVLGKVFVDCNRNSVQDEEELGIPGVRLYFSDGTFAITDVEGKYSYCGIEPRSATLKVDGSTLPRGAALTTSSNRNLGDANSLFLDLKNGELHRADFIEGGCSNRVIEQVKARRGSGEVSAPETEPGQPGLRFQSKPPAAPAQATDSADQPAEQPRRRAQGGSR